MNDTSIASKQNTYGKNRDEVFEYPVEVPLTDKDLIAYADELTGIDTDIKAADATLATAKAHHKSETERLSGRMSIVIDRLRTKREFRDIECHNDFNHLEGICSIVREDNGKVVTTRKMTDKEFKEALPFPVPKAVEKASS